MPTDRQALSESLKLRALLRQLPQEKLLAISARWGFTQARSAGDSESATSENLADFLYPRMNSANYFHQMWNRLEEEERETLKFLAIQGGQLFREELVARQFKGAIRSYKKTVDSLLEKGLVYEGTELPGLKRSEQWLLVPEVFLSFIELPIHCENFLGRLLLKCSQEDLFAIAHRVMGVDEATTQSPLEIRLDLRKHLLEPENLHTMVESLPEAERQVFDDLLNRKGQCLYRELLDSTGARKVDHSKAEYINSLSQTSGLVFTVSEGHNKYMNSLMIPRDIYNVITKRYQPDMRSLQRIEAMAGMRKVSPSLPPLDNSQDILRDLAIYAARLDVFQPKRLTTGGINKTDIKKVSSIFPSTKQGRYTTFLTTYLLDSGMFLDIEGSWKASEDLIHTLESAEATYMHLFQWWLKTNAWNSLYVDAVPAGGDRPAQLTTNIVELRLAVLSALAAVQKDRWIDFSSFWENLVSVLDARLPKGSGGGGYGGILSIKDAVSILLREAFYFLGITLIANSGVEYDTSIRTRTSSTGKKPGDVPFDFQFKLSPLGRSIVNSQAVSLTYEPSTDPDSPVAGLLPAGSKWIIVQPNLEIVAPRDLILDANFQLARLCAIKNMDVMTTMELSRESLQPMVQRGATPEYIENLLTSLSQRALPENVRQLIEESSVRHTEVRLGSSSGYIITEDNTVLESIWRHPRLTPYIKERHGENVLLLANDTDLGRVAKELRNQGHTPHMETGTVHGAQDNRFHLSLTELEMQDLVAAVRLLTHIERTLDSDLSDGRAAILAQRLQPDSTGVVLSGTGVENRSKQLQRRFDGAFNKHNEQIVEKYKTQVSKLVSRSMTSRGPSKYQYKGANPAVDREDIAQLLTFAQEYELEVELLYIKQNEQETRVTVLPRGLEGERLYAHNLSTDSDAVYSLARVLRARLL